MASIKILDSGYVANAGTATQTQLGDSDRAGYTGSAVTSFTLKTQNLTLGGEARTESKSVINTLTDVSTSIVSVGNRTIGVSAILKKDITTAGYNINNVIEVSRLDRTRGLKLLYPSSTGDVLPTIVEALGANNTGGNFAASGSGNDDGGTVGSATPYLIGRVKNLSITDGETGNYWRISFNFEFSG